MNRDIYVAYFKERSLWNEGVRSRDAFKQLWTELVEAGQ